MSGLCILLSTFERYRALANHTRARIQKHWPGHPEIFLGGLGRGEGALPLSGDARNWMRTTLGACSELQNRGYSWAYVILDDHPPMGACHARHLNETIPAVAAEFDATSVSLSGYGQCRRRFGRIVEWNGFHLDQVPGQELWKFPLHPALWNLSRMEVILRRLIGDLPEEQQTAWAFERIGGATNFPAKISERCFRIDGLEMSARRFPVIQRLPLAVAQRAADAYRLCARVIFGIAAREAADRWLRGLYCPYDGPYPLFWSGLMHKGKGSREFAFYARFSREARGILNELPPEFGA